MAETTVWLCTSGADYEDSGVEVVCADVHGARSWLTKQRRRVIREARVSERRAAEAEERTPDYSHIPNCPIWTNDTESGFTIGATWYRITPWRVTP